MASRTEQGTGDSKDKVRFLESKVYTRKGKGTKKNTTAASTTTILTSPSANPATNNNTSITVNPPPYSDTTSFTDNSTYIGVTADPAKDTSVTADLQRTETSVNPTNKDTSSTADPANNSSFTTDHANNENSFPANPASNSKENNNDKEDEVNNHKDDSVEQHSQAIAAEEAASSQHQAISRPDAVADDVSSLNKQQDVTPGWPLENGIAKEVEDERFKVNVPSRSKDEVRELKRKLESELNLVRSWAKKFEDKALQIVNGGGNGGVMVTNSKMSLSHGVDNGVRRVHPDIASAGFFLEGVTPRQSKPLNHLSISVLENNQVATENVEKEKRTPKANQFYRNTEFLLAKDKFPPAESNKRPKLNGKKHGVELGHGFGSGSKVFRSCSSLLERLMKHKHGWVFQAPVAVEALGLHDYFDIIKYPMDLGTVKSRLNKNLYKSPREFAEDVRLTFSNAMIYNPVGQDVHVMAEQLSKIFEEKWASIELDYNHEMRLRVDYATVQTPTSRKAPPFRPPPLDMKRILDRSESTTHLPPPSVRTPAPKKPKAKDLHKRDMTYDEKKKLSISLQNLPPEKLNNIAEIIKKRNSTLSQHEDEIEVDIDSVDAETLWELDRFVTNFKKSLSKNKRKAERALEAQEQAVQNAQKQLPTTIAAEASKEMDMDGRNISGSPVRGRVGDNASSSSSSSSSDSGSSSSDSDSDSSSSSESDEGHSPRT